MNRIMDIAAYVTNMKQADLANQVSVTVARKSLDAQKQQGEAALQLLEAAAQIAPGASPDGVGAGIDVRA